MSIELQVPVKLLDTERGALAPARVLAVGSGKGGSGKSSVCAGVAAVLRTGGGGPARHVVVLDADYQASLTRLMGASPSRSPLADPPVVTQSGVTLFAAGAALHCATRAQVCAHVERAVAAAAGGVLLVDLRPDLLDDWHAALLARPDMFLLAVPELAPASIPELRKLTAMAEARGRRFLIVGNRDARRNTVRRTRDLIALAFPGDLALQRSIPTCTQAESAFEVGAPVTVHAPGASASQALQRVAEQLVQMEVA